MTVRSPIRVVGVLKSARNLEPVVGAQGWRQFREANGVFDVQMPEDWLYTDEGELMAPLSLGGAACVRLIPYLPDDTYGHWGEWVREHIRTKGAEKTKVGKHRAVMVKLFGAQRVINGISTYIGLESLGRVYVFLLEVYKGDPELRNFVKTYQRMLRSLRIHDEVMRKAGE